MHRRHKSALLAFLFVGAALAITIVHNNIMALTRGHHPRPLEGIAMPVLRSDLLQHRKSLQPW